MSRAGGEWEMNEVGPLPLLPTLRVDQFTELIFGYDGEPTSQIHRLAKP